MKKILFIPLLIIVGLLLVNNIEASTLSPVIQEVFIEQGSSTSAVLTYKNTSGTDVTLTPKFYLYDSEFLENNQLIINSSNLDSTQVIKNNDSLEVEVYFNSPVQIEPGSYLNTFALIEITTNKDNSSINIQKGLGSVFKINVVSSDIPNQYAEAFENETELSINVLKKGFLFIPIEFEVVLKNNSDFIFEPTGGVTVISDNKDHAPFQFVFNSSEEKLYPNKEIKSVYKVDAWSWKNIFFDMNVKAELISLASRISFHKEINVMNNFIVFVLPFILLCFIYFLWFIFKRYQFLMKKK